jgi:hypothetical protein
MLLVVNFLRFHYVTTCVCARVRVYIYILQVILVHLESDSTTSPHTMVALLSIETQLEFTD